MRGERFIVLKGGSPANRFGVSRVIPELLLECRFLADGLPCAERVALHTGESQQR